MISITNLAKNYGSQTLFVDASQTFNRGACYGVVGANGSGKSSLLRILSGDEEASAGSISIPRKARVGVLEQDHFKYEEVPIVEVVMMGHTLLWEAIQAKDALLEKAGEHFDADRYSELEEIILRHDGYSLEARASEILAGLNVDAAVHRQLLSTLSGGFKLRALLAQTLASDPDILLLDEPTNHLDILSIRWLEKFIETYKGSALIVSHDHRFLNNVCTHIVDVDYERVTVYKGNYNAFLRAKQESRDRMEAEIGKREKEISDHRRFVERFKAKPTKARQAKSKVKQMERIVIEELPQSSRRFPKFSFKSKRASGKQVVKLDGISKAYNGVPVLENVSLTVRRDDRLAIIGPNGIGKSTLLKIMMGVVEPDAGEVEWGYETHAGYFAQDHKELLTGAKEDLQSWLWNFCSGEPIGFVRNRLAAVLFQKDEVNKRVANLSGGESARLIFARLGVEQPNVLVLDEPTNHLDMEGIESLQKAVSSYDGTTVFVSHDRWLVSHLATRVIEIRPDGLEDFEGSYDEYLERCGDDHLDVDSVMRKERDQKRSAREDRKKT